MSSGIRVVSDAGKSCRLPGKSCSQSSLRVSCEGLGNAAHHQATTFAEDVQGMTRMTPGFVETGMDAVSAVGGEVFTGQLGERARGIAADLVQGVTTGVAETSLDALGVIGVQPREAGLQDTARRGKVRYFWFKYTCCYSWVTIGCAFSMFITTIVCLGELSNIHSSICSESEITLNTNNSCREVLREYAECLNGDDPITSSSMRLCFLELDAPQGVDGAERAYNLALRYENGTIPAAIARDLMLQEIELEESSRRMRRHATEEGGAIVVQEESAPAPREEMIVTVGGAAERSTLGNLTAGSFLSTLVMLTVPGLPDVQRSGLLAKTASDVQRIRQLQSSEALDEAETALNEAYHTIAVGSALALIGAGMLKHIYMWTSIMAVLGLLSSLLALRSLGNGFPGCFRNPKKIEKMHKVGLRCACHLGWFFGLIVLLWSTLSLAKYQVLFRYLDSSGVTVPERWDVPGMAWVCLPCILGVILGFLPTCGAMMLSRSRAERRDALIDDLGAARRYQQAEKPAKKLTSPQRMFKGPAPNPASLNPIFDRV